MLIERLSLVFREVGYTGASLGMLADAAGLQKASLYHRFPGGKQQMAGQVLDTALDWFAENVLRPLEREGDPRERLFEALLGIDGFYAGGARACLLNVFGADEGPFTLRIKDALNALIAAFAKLAADAGQPAERAGRSAERAATMLQGSLVLSRGLGTQTPFRNMLLELPRELLK